MYYAFETEGVAQEILRPLKCMFTACARLHPTVRTARPMLQGSVVACRRLPYRHHPRCRRVYFWGTPNARSHRVCK